MMPSQIIPGLALLTSLFLGPRTTGAADKDFACTAEALELLEGGPATIRLTLKYRGDRPVYVLSVNLSGYKPYANMESCVSVIVPRDWGGKDPVQNAAKKFNIGEISDGPAVGVAPQQVEVKPGESFQTDIHLHHRFPKVSAGQSKLRFRWDLSTGKGQTISLSTWADIAVDVLPATAERIDALRIQLLKNLSDKGCDTLRRAAIVKQLSHCKHLQLLPILFDIVGREEQHGDSIEASYAIASMIRANSACRAPVLDYLLGSKPRGAPLILRHIFVGTDSQMGADDSRELAKAANIWVRTIVWASGDSKDEKFLDELASLVRHIDKERLEELLRQLDSPAFPTRQKAEEELSSLGQAAIPFIRTALKRRLTPEQRDRAGRILTVIEKPRDDPLAIDIMQFLAEMKTARARMVLSALAKNEPTSWIAIQAVAALKR